MNPPPDNSDSQSLRDQVESEELSELFSEDPECVAAAVRRLVRTAREDSRFEHELVETLSLALDEGCDDTDASTWIVVILGEIGSARGLPTLLRCLALEDEALQHSAGVALLRIGTPALALLMDWVDDDYGVAFNRRAYRVLGASGVIDDPVLHRRVATFLEDRWGSEVHAAGPESAIEELIEALARIGHRASLPRIKQHLQQQCGGCHFLVEDSIAVLEENEAGLPFVPTVTPWEESYGWVFRGEAREADEPDFPAPRKIATDLGIFSAAKDEEVGEGLGPLS